MIIILLALFTYFTQFQTVPLAYGDVIHDEITPQRAEFHYEFDGRAGDVILIDLLIPVNTRVEAALRLTLPDGEVVIASEDESTLAHIGPLMLTEDGRHQIDVMAFAGAGLFTLQLTSTEEIAPIDFDKPLEVGLDAAHPLVYLRFDNDDADMLHLEARHTQSPGTRPNLRVFDLAGNRISDGAYFRETGIDPLPAAPDTTYIIALQRNLPETASTRRYQVSIRPSAVNLLEPGTEIQGNPGDVQFFAAEAGQQIRVDFAWLGSAPPPDLSIRSIDGAYFLLYTSGDALNELSATLSIPATMLYAIEITENALGSVDGSYLLGIGVIDW